MTVPDVERALVGAVLVRPKAIGDVEVRPDDFADPRLGALWGLMLALDSEGTPPGAVAVGANLHRLEVRGVDAVYLADLINGAELAPTIPLYERKVVEGAVFRRLVAAGQRIVQLGTAAEGDPLELQETARAEVDAASRATATIRLIGEEIDDTITALAEQPNPAMSTPWPDLDYLIGGWRPGGFYVVGARPGKGKSILGLQAAIGLTEHGMVAFHSLEMPRAEVHNRAIAQIAGVSLTRLEQRALTDNDWDRVSAARGRFAAMPLAIDDRSAVRPVDIRSHARTLARRGKVAGIVVDYLQLMTPARGDRRPRHEQVAEWSRQLKILAKEMECPVIALSQLNRESEARQDRRPLMSDLRESGAVEQDSDVILLLHVDEDEDPSVMHVLVAKNRQGQTGALRLNRRGDVARLDPYKWRPSMAADGGVR